MSSAPAESESYISQDDVEKKVKDFKSFLTLMKFAIPYKTQFILAFSLMMLGGGFTIISARYMGSFVEEGLIPKNWERAYFIAGAILILEILSIMAVWRGRRVLAYASSKSILEIRKTLFKHIHLLPISYYDHQPEGRTVTRMTHDIEGIEEFFTSSLGRLLNSFIIFIMALFAMILTDFKMGSFLVLALVPAILTLFLSKNKIRFLNRDVSLKNSACNAKLSEYLKGLSVIRTFGLEKWSEDNYEKQLTEHLNVQLEANKFYSWTRPLTNLLCALPLIVLFWFGGKNVLLGAMSLGTFVAFTRYCERISQPISILTREIHIIQQAFTSVERVSAFLQAKKEDDLLGKDGWIDHFDFKGKIVFKDVTMSYDKGKTVLDQVSFEIKPGEKIGIVGATGSGKTTTISLLARLYEYQDGSILLDDQSIRHFKRNLLRENLGLVSQDVVIYRGSLYENLTCDKDIPLERVLEAVAKTGLNFVMKKNNWTLDTEILDGGANLSGGEKQIISISRVLLKNPSILILDEATASIDPQYEKIIHHAIEYIMHQRTCLIIAHRLETLVHCDRIMVFSDGKIVETGDHQSLMDKEGYFFKLQNNANKETNITNISTSMIDPLNIELV